MNNHTFHVPQTYQKFGVILSERTVVCLVTRPLSGSEAEVALF